PKPRLQVGQSRLELVDLRADGALGAAVLEELAQERQRQELGAAALPLDQDELGHDAFGEVLAALGVDDAHLLARGDGSGELLERDVARSGRVVEAPVAVLLDEGERGVERLSDRWAAPPAALLCALHKTNVADPAAACKDFGCDETGCPGPRRPHVE